MDVEEASQVIADLVQPEGDNTLLVIGFKEVVQKVYDQAFDEGSAEGWQEGFDEGNADGWDEGYARGVEVGQEDD